jgi:MFS family permease
MYRRKYHEAMHRIRSSEDSVPRPLWLYFAATLLLFSGFSTVYTPFPIFLKSQVGSGWLEIFLLYIISAVTSALMYSRAGDIIPRLGERKTLLAVNFVRVFLFSGFAVLALILAGGARPDARMVFWVLLVLQAAVGFFWAFVSVASTALVSRCAPPGTKGVNLGLFNAMVSVGGITGALVGGEVANYLGYSAAFFSGVALVVAGMAALAANPKLDNLGMARTGKEWKEPE